MIYEDRDNRPRNRRRPPARPDIGDHLPPPGSIPFPTPRQPSGMSMHNEPLWGGGGGGDRSHVASRQPSRGPSPHAPSTYPPPTNCNFSAGRLGGGGGGAAPYALPPQHVSPARSLENHPSAAAMGGGGGGSGMYPAPMPMLAVGGHPQGMLQGGGGGAAANALLAMPPLQLQQLYYTADWMAHAIVQATSSRRTAALARLALDPMPLDQIFPPRLLKLPPMVGDGGGLPMYGAGSGSGGQLLSSSPRMLRATKGYDAFYGGSQAAEMNAAQQEVQQQLDSLDAWIRGQQHPLPRR